jgi:hypothetical protein
MFKMLRRLLGRGERRERGNEGEGREEERRGERWRGREKRGEGEGMG